MNSPVEQPGTASTPVEDPYRRAFTSAGDGIILFDLKGTYREPNERACEILGYEEAELRTIPLRDLVAQVSYRSVLRAFLFLRRKGRTTLDVGFRRKSGRLVTVEVSAANAGYGQFIAILRDVTGERREHEQIRADRDTLQARLEAVPYPQALFIGRKLVSANRSFGQRFPRATPGEKGPTLLQFFGKQNLDIGRSITRLLDRNDSPFVEKQPIRLRLPEEGRVDFDLTIDAGPNAGQREVVMTFIDTTPFQTAVREHEDAALSFRGLVESNAIAAVVIKEGRCLFVNRGFQELLGFDTPGEIVGQEFTGWVTARDRKGVLHKLTEKAPAPGETLELEFSLLRKNGKSTRVDVRCAPVDFEGQSALLLSFRDIGGTMKSTAEVRRRLDDLEAVERIAETVRHVLDPDAAASMALDASMRILGFEAGGVYLPEPDAATLTLVRQVGLSDAVVEKIGVQNTLEGVTGFIARTLEPQVLVTESYPAHLPYKSLFATGHIETVVYVPLVVGEELQGILLLCGMKAREPEDIGQAILPALGKALGSTLRNARTYKAMEDAERQYRLATEGIPDTVYVASPSGAFLLLSPQVERLTGFRASDYSRDPELWRNTLHPDERVRYSERISNQHNGAEQYEMIYRLLPKGKAEYRWMRDAYRYIRDANGAVLSINGVVSDVTEQMAPRQAADGLVTGEILESMQEGILVLDKDLRFTFWNRAMETLTDVAREDMVGTRASELPAGHPAEALRGLLDRALAGEHVSQDDLFVPHNNETRYLWARCSPVRNGSGVIVGVAGAVTDVTGRRNLEHELRESEETLRKVIDGMGDALMITDLQGKIWEVNREFSSITGYPRGEVLRMEFPYPWIVDEEMANFVAWINALREKKSLRDFDMVWKRRDGTAVSISLSTTLLRTATGEPMAMLNLARDISERKQMANELSAKNRQIEMLNRIISKANTRMDFGTIFDIIAVEVLNLLAYDLIAVTLLTEDGEQVRLFACMSPGHPDLPVGTTVPIQRSLSRPAIESRQPVVVVDLTSDHRFGSDLFMPVKGLKSLISIPIILNDRVLGGFTVAAVTENAFSGGELAILQPIADQVGALLDRTQLFQRVSDDSKYIRQLYTEVQAQMQRITTLYELGKGLSGAVDTPSLLEVVQGEVAKEVPFDLFTYDTFDDGAGKFERIFATGPDIGDGRAGVEAELAESALSTVLRGESYLGDTDDAGSLIAVPVLSKGKILGVLAVRRKPAGSYSVSHLRLLESIANLTGIAIDRAGLYEDTVAKSVEIENRNKELDDFTYVVSHDLKEPLITIEGYSKIVLKEYRERVDQEGQAYLSAMVQSTARMKSLIEDLLTLSRLGRLAGRAHTVSVQGVLADVLHDFEFTLRQKNAVVEVADELPEVRYDSTQLGMVFRNLISNAVKFNTGLEPRVRISVTEGEKEYTFSVADNGIGIERQHFDKVFVIFQRLHRREEYEGTGAGLTIVKKIVERHHGRIWVESEIGKGTTFYFTVPK